VVELVETSSAVVSVGRACRDQACSGLGAAKVAAVLDKRNQPDGFDKLNQPDPVSTSATSRFQSSTGGTLFHRS